MLNVWIFGLIKFVRLLLLQFTNFLNQSFKLVDDPKTMGEFPFRPITISYQPATNPRFPTLVCPTARGLFENFSTFLHSDWTSNPEGVQSDFIGILDWISLHNYWISGWYTIFPIWSVYIPVQRYEVNNDSFKTTQQVRLLIRNWHP